MYIMFDFSSAKMVPAALVVESRGGAAAAAAAIPLSPGDELFATKSRDGAAAAAAAADLLGSCFYFYFLHTSTESLSKLFILSNFFFSLG